MFPSCRSKPTGSFLQRTSLTKILLGVFVVYVLHTCWVIYGFVYTKPCDRGRGDNNNCMSSYLAGRPRLQLSVYSCLKPDYSELSLVTRIDDFDIHLKFQRTVNVSLPEETRDNGTLHTVVYLHKFGVSPLQDGQQAHHAAQLTTYMLPKQPVGNLSSDKEALEEQDAGSEADGRVSHWRPRLTLNIMSEDFTFSRGNLPSDVRRYMRVLQEGQRVLYLPLLLIDELGFRVKDLMVINSNSTELPLTISYESKSLREFRLWIHIQDAIYSLKHFGFTEDNIDEIKGVLLDSNLYLLALTALVIAFHLIIEIMAFKNDITYWRKKKTMVGMSRKSVLWRCFSTIVIFLHLLEEKTSLLVIIPVGIGSIIEVWKVKKVFKIQLQWKRSKSIIQVGKLDESERRTTEHDTQAMKYLSYLVYPLCISGAIYSLVYLKYKSNYSWSINSLISGIYAFGFLSMAPQLFINYKMKSISYSQWTVLMYKAINTLINDVFTCVFSTPSPHQLSCFRDEILFLIYLFQRRIYTVNRTRGHGAKHKKKLKAQ